jgi:hypothetical protein
MDTPKCRYVALLLYLWVISQRLIEDLPNQLLSIRAGCISHSWSSETEGRAASYGSGRVLLPRRD